MSDKDKNITIPGDNQINIIDHFDKPTTPPSKQI